MKRFFIACDSYASEKSDSASLSLQKNINEAFSKIDKAVKRGVMHKNNAANQKARLSLAHKKAIGSEKPS